MSNQLNELRASSPAIQCNLMEVLLPPADLLQGGLHAIQISETVWLVPCTVNLNDNEYSPLLRPFNLESKQKTRHTWSSEEDNILVSIVKVRGPKSWNAIAKELNVQLYGDMPVRQGKQCRERWHNHLNPNLRKGNWRASEDVYIFKKQIEIGNHWSEIAKGIEGRTENSVKNRWKCMMKKAKRRHPHCKDLAGLILAEREKKSMDDNHPSSSESDQSAMTPTNPKALAYVEYPNSEDPVFSLKFDYLPYNLPHHPTPIEFYAPDANPPPYYNGGFTQYAEFSKHFGTSQSTTTRESDFSPSPSLFIRSPH